MNNKDINNFQISTNFNLKEFACKGTREVKISNDLVAKLQWVRNNAGKPIVITSGYRTADYNKKVNGVSNSQHLRGSAVDISIIGHNKFALRTYLKQAGFLEVILNSKKQFIHAGLYEK